MLTLLRTHEGRLTDTEKKVLGKLVFKKEMYEVINENENTRVTRHS